MAVKSWVREDKIKELDQRLTRCEGAMGVHLLNVMQTDFKKSFTAILDSSEHNRNRITAIQENVETLRQGVRIGSLDDAVMAQLREMLEASDKHMLKRRQNVILRALRFDAINDRFAGVVEAHQKTFGWLFDDDDRHRPEGEEDMDTSGELRLQARENFISWLEEEYKTRKAGIFHVLGKPGSGKSTLMKFLYRHDKTKEHLKRWVSEKELIFCPFFFWKPGSDIQKSQRGLVRALLFSILSAAPDLIPVWFPTQSARAEFDDVVDLDQHVTEEVFYAILRAPETYERRRFVFFLDGLDEFEDKQHHRSKLFLVQLMLKWVEQSSGNLKLCISSREQVEFESGFKTSPHFRLQDLTRSDMKTVINSRLADLNTTFLIDGVHNSNLEHIGRIILGHAQGVFLWVTLVLTNVECGLLQGDSPRALEQKVKDLPSEINDLLQRIFNEIHSSDRRKAMRTFQLVKVMGALELCLTHYSFWVDVVDNPEFVFLCPTSRENEAQVEVRLLKARRQIYGVCKGLVEIDRHKYKGGPHWRHVYRESVMFTHRSVVEFLQGPEIQASMLPHTERFNPILMMFRLYVAHFNHIIPRQEEFEGLNGVVSRMLESHVRNPKYCSREDTEWFCKLLDELLKSMEKEIDPAEYDYMFFRESNAHWTPAKGTPKYSPSAKIALDIVEVWSFHEYFLWRRNEYLQMIKWSDTARPHSGLPRVYLTPMEQSQSLKWSEDINSILEGIFEDEEIPLRTVSFHFGTILWYWINCWACEPKRYRMMDLNGLWTFVVNYVLYGGDLDFSILLSVQLHDSLIVTARATFGAWDLKRSSRFKTYAPFAALLLARCTQGTGTVGFKDFLGICFTGRPLALLYGLIDERVALADLDQREACRLLRRNHEPVANLLNQYGYEKGESAFHKAFKTWAEGQDRQRGWSRWDNIMWRSSR